MTKNEEDKFDIKIPSFKDGIKIVEEKSIETKKAESHIIITQYKSVFAMIIIGFLLFIGIVGYFYFSEDGKKYAASISLINLILGSVVGYLYGNSEKTG